MNAQQAYQAAMEHLRALAALKDWSPEGEKAFFQAREDCYWKKCALVLSEVRAKRKDRAS